MNKSAWKALEYARDGMFVPQELTDELLDIVDGNNKRSVLVLFSFEMLPVLKERGYKNVTLFFPNPKKYLCNIVNKYGYETIGTLEDMTFEPDVILGNPPFQDEGGHNTEYPHFYNKAIEIIADGGTVALITPQNMIDSLTKDNCDSIKFARKVVPTLVNVNNIERHFPGVGSTFCYFLLEDFDNTETKLVTNWGETTFDPTTTLLSMMTTKPRADFAQAYFHNDRRDVCSGDAGNKIVDGNQITIFDSIKDGQLVGERTIAKPAKKFVIDPYRPKVMFNMLSAGKVGEAFLDLEDTHLPSAKHTVCYLPCDSKEEAQAAYDSLTSEKFEEFRALFQNRSTIGFWFYWIRDYNVG